MNHLYKYRQDLGKVARDGGILPSYQHQEAIIIIRAKGQLRGYQNPKRSVTGAGWQRGPLREAETYSQNHTTALATQIQQERTGYSTPLLMYHQPKPKRNHKIRGQLIEPI